MQMEKKDDDSINRMGGVVIGIGPRLQVKTPHEKWQLLNYLVTKIDGGANWGPSE